MSADESDAPPTRVGQAVTPTTYVMGGIAPDGNFVLDAPDDEMVGRGILNMLMCELDRYYVNRRMKQMLDAAKDRRVIEGMMGPDARRFKGLR